MQNISRIVGDDDVELPNADELKTKIYAKYYKPEQGGFIDGFVSGKNKISRQQNVLAIMLDFASDEEKRLILERVLLNDTIEPITTPYFKFYELVALCKMGRVEIAQDMIESYWGGMLNEGATSFWEEYDPRITDIGKYSMYGNKFGKSLCHAWGSGPICLLEKFVAGVSISSEGGKTFEVRPNPGNYKEFSARVPVGNGFVIVNYKNGKISVDSTVEGGTLYFRNEIKPILINIHN